MLNKSILAKLWAGFFLLLCLLLSIFSLACREACQNQIELWIHASADLKLLFISISAFIIAASMYNIYSYIFDSEHSMGDVFDLCFKLAPLGFLVYFIISDYQEIQLLFAA